MRRRPPKSITLTHAERSQLEELIRDGHTPQRIARRAHILLAMASPDTVVEELAQQVAYTRTGIWYVCRRFESLGLDTLDDAPRSGHPRELSALERVEIEQLACCDPLGLGLQLTHWSTRSLATVARKHLKRPRLAHSTVSLILRNADLQPHRYRYWKTPTLDAQFVEQSSRILWCYEQVDRLQARDEIVLALDEKPNLQALERDKPLQPMRPGQVERQEFEYTRHGTVNFLMAMNVYDGSVEGRCLEANDSEHLCPVLAELFKRYRGTRRLHLIWDNGASHISGVTHQFLRSYQPWLRVLFTPPHASWLNQCELVLRAFSERYLKRGSWQSRQALIEHLLKSSSDYDRLFARPIEWTWTRRDMREWVKRSVPGLC